MFIKNIYFILIVVVVVVDVECCRTKKTEYKPLEQDPIQTTSQIIIRALTTGEKFIDYGYLLSNQTCNSTLDPNKELIHCYNKGLCKTAEIPLNETHRFLRHYCECTEGYTGELCREEKLVREKKALNLAGSNTRTRSIVVFLVFLISCCVIIRCGKKLLKMPKLKQNSKH